MVIFNALLNLSELKELYSGKPVCVCPLYKGVINAPKTFEATGNPIVLPEYKSLVKLTTTFSPKQAGTGDPSPENVRSISGYDEVTVNVRGKNLVNIPNINADTPSTDVEVYIPFTLTVSANYDDVTLSESVWRIRFQLQNGEYEYAIDGQLPFTVTGTPDNPITVIQYRGTRIKSGEITEIQLELGSTPTTYEPYQPGTTATLTLPETIYGGTVDCVTGAGSKTWGFIASYNGETLPGEWISDRDVYAPGTTPTTGAQVAYKLATPESFKVSQVSIPSLRGENYFFTNGENMDIIYKKESFWSDEA
nr:MAG: hypothetical protein [Bacteriophage sp.]